ncbi:MAG: ParB/RepB/Spo0J family partition protein [Endomicrobiales bacterium]|nr:ParB/RepB/Spo0J family partition protein [Endomicrobiales bacterium]
MHNALGRGLESLIPNLPAKNQPQAHNGEIIVKLQASKIKPNRHQPRKHFDETKIKELAHSIKTHGLTQPLVVTHSIIPGEYELIAGERRLRACILSGLSEVPAIVRQVDDKTRFEISLIENIQREDLNPIDEAGAYKRLYDEFGHTQEELAAIVGKDRSVVANALRLLTLPKEVQALITSGQLSSGHGRALAGITDTTRQKALAALIVKEKLSVRETEKLVSEGKTPLKTQRKTTKPEIELVHLCEELQRRLGTKVKIKGKANKGKIEIHYFTLSDLERIAGILKAKK